MKLIILKSWWNMSRIIMDGWSKERCSWVQTERCCLLSDRLPRIPSNQPVQEMYITMNLDWTDGADTSSPSSLPVCLHPQWDQTVWIDCQVTNLHHVETSLSPPSLPLHCPPEWAPLSDGITRFYWTNRAAFRCNGLPWFSGVWSCNTH